MATNEIQSTAVPLEFSADGTTWQAAVCRTSNSFNLDVSTAEEETDCGNIVGIGVVKWGFDFSGYVNSSPTVDEQVSYKQFLTWANAGTKIYVRQQAGSSGASFYQSGQGYITSLKAEYATGKAVAFSAQFKGVGALDITP